ncbi:aspartyl-phosphate phosphatase Spo0E family protein (plasmid) [Bacillus sp. S3]|uniref:aspartyl-phosphate phosphatase Spo0E family protein n=1 Tax=Bacillus sp. S3 TaxID=486398 RepID=UPI00118BDCBA|nr:aspartyl-phosphate phosphatase Spo0E family protein [Bacillus sp. S3]QCJ45395.1 aspartyl-phosphate phosphatase Spo0E family protein [Bacillus sp. S3]
MNAVLFELLLLEQINLMKKKMVELSFSTGISSYETLTCSQELDNLLNLHMRHFSNKNKLSNAY